MVRELRSVLPAVALLCVLGCPATEDGAPVPPPGGGTGGSGGEPGCADLSATGDCRAQSPTACPAGELCAIASRSCGAERCCIVSFECREPVGPTPGGYRCEADSDCASGSCVQVGGTGLCLRACEAGSCPEGLDCVLVSLSNAASVHTCVGNEDGVIVAERTLCRSDRDCVAGRYCRIVEGAAMNEGLAHGVCVSGARSGETGRACEAENLGSGDPGLHWEGFSYLCPESGLCRLGCDGVDPNVCTCEPEPGGACRGAHCTQPCAADAECPGPFICRFIDSSRITNPDPDLFFKICMLPSYVDTDWGCFDETDCCKNGVQLHGVPCCNRVGEVCSVPPAETTYCRVTTEGAHYGAVCQLPAGKAGIGAPCTGAADCESGLCAPDGSCTSPCLIGVGDRCEQIVPGSSCCPTQLGDACVPACRLDCTGGPGCNE